MTRTPGWSAAMKKFLVLLGVVSLALIAVGSAHLATASANVASPSAPLPCGPGLAAQDLAGVCRSKPNPTPGALEVVGERNSIKMKIQSKPQSRK